LSIIVAHVPIVLKFEMLMGYEIIQTREFWKSTAGQHQNGREQNNVDFRPALPHI